MPDAEFLDLGSSPHPVVTADELIQKGHDAKYSGTDLRVKAEETPAQTASRSRLENPPVRINEEGEHIPVREILTARTIESFRSFLPRSLRLKSDKTLSNVRVPDTRILRGVHRAER